MSSRWLTFDLLHRVDRRWNERSPIYNHPSSVADSPSEVNFIFMTYDF